MILASDLKAGDKVLVPNVWGDLVECTVEALTSDGLKIKLKYNNATDWFNISIVRHKIRP